MDCGQLQSAARDASVLATAAVCVFAAYCCHQALTLSGVAAELLEPLPEGDVQRADRLPLLLLVHQVLDGPAASQPVVALLVRLGPVPVVPQTLHVLHDLHSVLAQHLLRRLLALRGEGHVFGYGAARRLVSSSGRHGTAAL